MNELIKVNMNEKQEPVVCARDLHEYLEIKDNYTDWFKRMVDYGFTESEDFIGFFRESTGGRKAIEHHITIDMAKELCMIQRNEKGKEARRYFIQVEKAYKQQRTLSPLQILEHQLQIMKEHERKLTAIETTVDNIKDTIIKESDHWREDVNRMINKIVKSVGSNKFSEVRNESYKALEQRAGVNLKQRLSNMRNRLLEDGASQTKIKNLNNMDVIEQDKKLCEIYMSIVKEYFIKYCA